MRADDVEPGRVVGGFTLTDLLCEQDGDVVFRASHPDQPRPLVLRAAAGRSAADIATIIRYETEAMILGRLSGSHVPRLIAAGGLTERPFIVTEAIAGRTLARRLAEGPVPEAEAIRLGLRIANALADLHDQKVLHLALSPQAIVLTEGGVVLTGFGHARHAELPDLHGDEGGPRVGCRETAAPEQLQGDRSHPASDIYALGAVLHRMATGVYPVDGAVAEAADLSCGLKSVIARCLSADPADRHRTPGQVAEDLRLALDGPRSLRPVLLVVDLDEGASHLEELRRTAVRVLRSEGGAHLICQAFGTRAPAIGPTVAERLYAWAAKLPLPEDQVSCEVVGSADPAFAVLEAVKRHRAGHLVIGAAGAERMVLDLVAAAPCSVTVVRAPLPADLVPLV